MRRYYSIIWYMLVFFSESTLANQQANHTDLPESFVTIDVEIKGLQTTNAQISQTMHALETTIESIDKAVMEMKNSPEKLTPQQIRELTDLIQAIDNMLSSASKTIADAENMFDEVQIPANRFVDGVIEQANAILLQPSIDKALKEIAIWRFSLIGLVSLVAVLLTYLILTSRNLIELVSNQYRLVHISRLDDEQKNQCS